MLHVLQGARISIDGPEHHLEAGCGMVWGWRGWRTRHQGPGVKLKSLGFLQWASGSHRGYPACPPLIQSVLEKDPFGCGEGGGAGLGTERPVRRLS